MATGVKLLPRLGGPYGARPRGLFWRIRGGVLRIRHRIWYRRSPTTWGFQALNSRTQAARRSVGLLPPEARREESKNVLWPGAFPVWVKAPLFLFVGSRGARALSDSQVERLRMFSAAAADSGLKRRACEERRSWVERPAHRLRRRKVSMWRRCAARIGRIIIYYNYNHIHMICVWGKQESLEACLKCIKIHCV